MGKEMKKEKQLTVGELVKELGKFPKDSLVRLVKVLPDGFYASAVAHKLEVDPEDNWESDEGSWHKVTTMRFLIDKRVETVLAVEAIEVVH